LIIWFFSFSYNILNLIKFIAGTNEKAGIINLSVKYALDKISGKSAESIGFNRNLGKSEGINNEEKNENGFSQKEAQSNLIN